MKPANNVLFFIAGAIVVFTFGCTSPFPFQMSNQTSVTSASEAGTGSVVVALKTGPARQTVVPDGAALVDSYIVTLSREGQNNIVMEGFGPFEFYDILIGNWSVSVGAFDIDGQTIGSGSASLNVSEGEINTVSVSVYPTTAGSGSVNISVTWPAGDVDFVQGATLTPLPEGSEATVLDKITEIDNGICFADDLGSGQYLFRVRLSKAGLIVATVFEVVYVYDNIMTTAELSIDGASIARPPMAVDLFGANSTSATSIVLVWMDPDYTNIGFIIERSDDGGTIWEEVARPATGYTSCTDSVPSVLTQPNYRICSYNDFGHSEWVETETTLPEAPQAPYSVAVSTITDKTVALSWMEDTSNSEYVSVEKSSSIAGLYESIATIDPGTCAYLVENLTPYTGYFFRITAGNYAASSTSDPVDAKTCIRLDEIPFTDSTVKDSVLSEAAGRTYNIEVTSLYNLEYLGISDLGGLEYLSQLDNLFLRDNNISDISALSAMKRLMTLELNNNNITDISSLGGLSNLRQLNLTSNQISDSSPLAALSLLETLDLSNNNLTDLSWVSGNSFPELIILDISHNSISELPDMAGMGALRTLFAEDTGLSDISGLSGATAMGDLRISNNSISDTSVFGSLPGLTYVVIYGNPIMDVVGIASARGLTTFYADDCGILSLEAFEGMDQLRTLSLNNNAISDVSTLSGVPSLETLCLSGNQITDVSPISSLTSIVSLDLSSNSDLQGTVLSDVSSICSLPALNTLNLRYLAIEDASPLAALTGLVQLDLMGNSYLASGVAELVSLTNAQSINLYFCTAVPLEDIDTLVAELGADVVFY